MSQQNTRPEALATSLAALPGAVVRPTEHAAKGYDLDVSLTPETLVPAVNILDAAGYFLETITGVDWLGEQAALRKSVLRIYHIQREEFLPSAYVMIVSFVIMILAMLMFAKFKSPAETLVTLALVSFFFLYLLRRERF